MIYKIVLIVIICFNTNYAQNYIWQKGDLIYENDFSTSENLNGWRMEGAGNLDFKNGWMHMYSPKEEGHHVLWCPIDFPDKFIAEWKVQNLEPDAGLCIVFFAAKGIYGNDIFDPSLSKRKGKFSSYINGDIRNYHISYYANTPNEPDRGKAHLRKNPKFVLVQMGEEGIPTNSRNIHKIRLIKNGPNITMYVDDRKIIDWVDEKENEVRSYYKSGKIGFRQMKWSYFRYKDFKVWSIKDK